MAVLPYATIPAWCHQGRDPLTRQEDAFGLCFYAMCGNHRIIQGGAVMPDVEIESAAREIDGFDEWIKATDHGENLEAGFAWIKDRGWPGDSTLRISDWSRIDLDHAADTIARQGAAESWGLLPMNSAGDDYDFTDDALARNAPGVHPHATLIVDAAPFFMVSWGLLKSPSRAWMKRYWPNAYEVVWTDVGRCYTLLPCGLGI